VGQWSQWNAMEDALVLLDGPAPPAEHELETPPPVPCSCPTGPTWGAKWGKHANRAKTQEPGGSCSEAGGGRGLESVIGCSSSSSAGLRESRLSRQAILNAVIATARARSGLVRSLFVRRSLREVAAMSSLGMVIGSSLGPEFGTITERCCRLSPPLRNQTPNTSWHLVQYPIAHCHLFPL
jgi:hypothetical protein